MWFLTSGAESWRKGQTGSLPDRGGGGRSDLGTDTPETGTREWQVGGAPTLHGEPEIEDRAKILTEKEVWRQEAVKGLGTSMQGWEVLCDVSYGG